VGGGLAVDGRVQGKDDFRNFLGGYPVDQFGNTYDAVGSSLPPQHFDSQWANVQSQIIKHQGKADFVPVDVGRLTRAQQETVDQFVTSLNDPSVYVVGM